VLLNCYLTSWITIEIVRACMWCRYAIHLLFSQFCSCLDALLSLKSSAFFRVWLNTS
jgi:hypothetical protein